MSSINHGLTRFLSPNDNGRDSQNAKRRPLAPRCSPNRSTKPEQFSPQDKKLKSSPFPGKENVDPNHEFLELLHDIWSEDDFSLNEACDLDPIEPTPYSNAAAESEKKLDASDDDETLSNSEASIECLSDLIDANLTKDQMKEGEEGPISCKVEGLHMVECPLCGADLSHFQQEARLLHTNDCLDKDESKTTPSDKTEVVSEPAHKSEFESRMPSVLDWLESIGLERYKDSFAREEIDWDTLKCLTEEDLVTMGITALGPRKKIICSLTSLFAKNKSSEETAQEKQAKAPENKRITDYFISGNKKSNRPIVERAVLDKSETKPVKKRGRGSATNKGKPKQIPIWCKIPGTQFLVDAFKYLKGDCCHWFLTHFHMDHYQGLTKSFRHGRIYCSSITAKLVNIKIGIPLARLEILHLNQMVNIDGVNVTCFDANHCPGALIILFEPPNGKRVLHTGDFRYSEEMEIINVLRNIRIHTLILDTTYCDPQYDFPKQDAVVQFVIEAIQAETFNPKTLFLIGSYSIGKERLFMEVARVLEKKVYINPTKFRLLECLDFPESDMKWMTLNENESQIHVVPLWTLASFKRLSFVANQHAGRFSLIVAFSPTGWSFGKGKKSWGKRTQQGTMIRYEVPYSEHSSYSELKEFVKLVSPEVLIPSVNNHSPDSAKKIISLLQ